MTRTVVAGDATRAARPYVLPHLSQVRGAQQMADRIEARHPGDRAAALAEAHALCDAGQYGQEWWHHVIAVLTYRLRRAGRR